MNIDIKGHSGCIIEVIEKDNKLYVKKSSNDPKYIERLYAQGRKQSLDNQDIINVPNIIDCVINKEESYSYILMDYIYAQNFIDYFEHASKSDIDNFIETFCKYINYELNYCEVKYISKARAMYFANTFKKKKKLSEEEYKSIMLLIEATY